MTVQVYAREHLSLYAPAGDQSDWPTLKHFYIAIPSTVFQHARDRLFLFVAVVRDALTASRLGGSSHHLGDGFLCGHGNDFFEHVPS